ncbi:MULTISPECIES: cupin domain-containing protein [unclassified Corynebacterium]|uniref:cupin domain-containing protein n=1 Tax=unclassified Corynebacterium TaxID=2624378 RepID=UPI0021687561|nr:MULTISPECIES: cupin domain-containing protein [unclassified Corynebacterium]MCS4489076.1 cupin domain-containing protein [Corynebacterium sp. ES2775-CONJ]MCS4531228.1 cupin domain-containing protein [Corynebacterium sp. ES2730-CONJ]
MNTEPVHTPETFGNLDRTDSGLTVIDAPQAAPQPHGDKPGVQRVARANGANIILFNFAPGQELKDHKAAHPITVQCLAGSLVFGCHGDNIVLTPGRVIHLDAHTVHRVSCPTEAAAENILLLTMLTPVKD